MGKTLIEPLKKEISKETYKQIQLTYLALMLN